MSFLFYGGRGGGKNKKSSMLEIGHYVALEGSSSSKLKQDLVSVKEFNTKWRHEHIRYDYRAFFLLGLYCEVLDKISVEQDFHSDEDQNHSGLFNVLSNAIFYLDSSVENKNFDSFSHLSIFICKLLFELGVAPNLEYCLYTDTPLDKIHNKYFLMDQGGFSSTQAISQEDLKSLAGHSYGESIYQLFKKIKHLPYKNYQQVVGVNNKSVESVFQYFCYQHQYELSQFKSYKLALS